MYIMLRIKEVLKTKGITQIELAEKLNISVVGLNKIINGNPTIETLQKIAVILNVEVKDLFKSSGGSINGFIEYKDTVYKIQSKSDLEDLLNLM